MLSANADEEPVTDDPWVSFDLVKTAEVEDISLSEAGDRYLQQSDINYEFGLISDQYPDLFAGAYFDEHGKPVIELKGSVIPTEVSQLMITYPHMVVRRLRPFSEVELDAFVVDLSDSLLEDLGPTSSYVAMSDQGRITIDVFVATTAESSLAQAAATSAGYPVASSSTATEIGSMDVNTASYSNADDAAAVSLAATNPVVHPVKPTVVVHQNTAFETSTANLMGGMPLSHCTSGFPIRRGTIAGLTTAGHCPNNLLYNGLDRLYPAVSANHLNPKFGDVQWHRGRVATLNQFQYDTNKFRPVTRNVKPGKSTRVCKYGKVSGAACTNVYSRGLCVKYADYHQNYCGVVLTRGGAGIQKGDSGGPWYYGQNAYGITSGWVILPYGGGLPWKTAVFTPTHSALPQMNLTLKTS